MEETSRQKPTNSELGILRVLWKRGPSSVREVFEDLNRTREIGYTTVLKLMQIMVEKGLLDRVESGRAHVYKPVEAEAEAKRDLVTDFMARAFGGSARELVLHALTAKPASLEELAEIRHMLDRLEAEHE